MPFAFAVAAAFLFAASPASARQTPPPAPAPAAFPAAPEDVASADAIIAALYDVISGEAGAPRDWDRFQSLFLPGATLGGVGRGPEGVARLRLASPADYIARNSGHFAAEPFHERETGRRTQGFGPLVTVLSAYRIDRTRGAVDPVQRGVNTIQLLNDGRRWWIVSVVWSGETPQTPIPAELSGGG
jgi:hypothetical protein